MNKKITSKKKKVPLTYDPTMMLSEDQAAELVDRANSALGLRFLNINKGHDFRDLVRTIPLKHACKAVRAKLGLSIKQIAGQIKVQQYYLKGAEGESDGVMESDSLVKYVDFLGIREYFEAWLKTNRDVFDRLEQKSASRRVGKTKKTG